MNFRQQSANFVKLEFHTAVNMNTTLLRGPGSAVCIATGYGMDGPGIEFRWRRDFPHQSRPALGANPASYTMGTGPFPGVKSGQGVTLTPHSLLVGLVMKE